MEHDLISQMHSHMKFHEMLMGLFCWRSRGSASITCCMSCQKLSFRFHVADVVSCCCMMRTSKQLYPDDDIELVHLERTSFFVKEHESVMGITTPTTG